MSDNRRVYRTIRTTMRQLFPTEPKGNQVRMLATLAAMVSGIVLGKSCQLPTIARKTPDPAKADSRIKRYSRWIQNERIDYEGYYLPFVSQLLHHLASIREWVFIIDGSEVGHGCITLMISLIYGHRTLSITWLVVSGCKGHLSERLHLDLLSQLQAIFLGMENSMVLSSKRLCSRWVCVMFAGLPKIPSFMKMGYSFRSLICTCAQAIRSVFQTPALRSQAMAQ
jgi:hypothetical protein